MLSKTRFRPRACVSKPDDLKVIPSDGSVLFIVGIEQNQDSICKVIRRKYPGSFIVAVSDETHLEELRSALDDGANAALLSSVSPPTLVSALNSVISGPLLVMDQHLWGVGVQPSEETSLELAPTKRAPPLFLDVPLIPNSPQWTTENDPQPVEQLSAREIAILARIVRGEVQQACGAILQYCRADGKSPRESDISQTWRQQSDPGGNLGPEPWAHR